jgi:hypothetical protein
MLAPVQVSVIEPQKLAGQTGGWQQWPEAVPVTTGVPGEATHSRPPVQGQVRLLPTSPRGKLGPLEHDWFTPPSAPKLPQVAKARQVPLLAALQKVLAPQAPHTTSALVQVFFKVTLQRAPTPAPHTALLVQHAPTSPLPARCGGLGTPASTEQARPPVQAQVRPVASPGNRVKVVLLLVLQRAPLTPLAGGVWVAHVR